MTDGNTLEEWLKFFQDAKLPKEYAESYAVTFAKHQMKLDMLPDISRDYLLDMGITLVGHIISIRRHAEAVYNQNVMRTTLSQCPSAPSEIKTAPVAIKTAIQNGRVIKNVNKMKDELVSQSLIRTSTKVRLNPSPATLSVTEIKKIRKVTPEQEGSYKIKMPSGTTARSREILAKKKIVAGDAEKKPVFERLGVEGSVSSSTEPNQDDQKPKNNITKCNKSDGEGVFSRLGLRCPVSSSEDVTEEQVSKPLPYIGILKTPMKPRPALKRSLSSSSLYLKEGTLHSDNLVAGVKEPILNKRLLLDPTASKQCPAFTISNTRITPEKIHVKERLGTKGIISSRKVINQPSSNGKLSVDERRLSKNDRDPKRVSFGTVSQQLIPKVNSNRLKNVIPPVYNYLAPPQHNFNTRGNSFKHPAGMGTGVFARLG